MAFTVEVETVTLALCIILFTISNLIFMPIEIYYTAILYSHRDSLIIAKRKPGLVVTGVALAAVFFLLNTTYAGWKVLSRNHSSLHTQLLLPVFIPIALLAWYVYIARLWLLFYQIQFDVETIAMRWQSIIDPTNSTKEWFHLHKETLGTWKCTFIILILYELCAMTIMILLVVLTLHNPTDDRWRSVWYTFHWIFSVVALYIPLLFILFISCKTPSHYDTIGLVKEVKCTALCFSAIVITTSIIDILFLQYIRDFEGVLTTKQMDMAFICVVLIWRVVFFLGCMIQTRWPVKRFRPILLDYTTSTGLKITHKATLAELKTINELNEDSLECSMERSESMKQVLNHSESFELFVKHCCSEHCLECILSVIEFIQFKDKLFKQIMSETDDLVNIEEMEEEHDQFLIIPESCPLSVIVHNDNMSHKAIARALYLKYIKVGSPFEINISYAKRKTYSRLMESQTAWNNETKYNSNEALLSLFDVCIKEMCKLLTAAFSRYKQCNQYKILKRHSVT
eukprot:579477_1